MRKKDFDIDQVITRIRTAVEPYPKAALFELAEEGYDSPFELLVACIISIRTRDEVTLPCARRLFEKARTPEALQALAAEDIDMAIRDSTFHEAKAGQIRDIAVRILEKHGGTLPCTRDVLLSFHGVGPKCANLVLGIACNMPYISVDTHVHRVTNRWGYVRARSPKGTLQALEEKLPPSYHVEINRLLVPFGKHICTYRRPHCSNCPVLEMCRQIGVDAHR